MLERILRRVREATAATAFPQLLRGPAGDEPDDAPGVLDDDGDTDVNPGADCPTCNGDGTVDGQPCPTCDGTGRVNDADTTASVREAYSQQQRTELASEGHALPDGSYPIANRADLKSAITLAQSGHGDSTAAKQLIKRRAKDLGATDLLPDDWKPAREAEQRKLASLAISLREAIKKADGVYEVVVIREGPGNQADRNYYTKTALRDAVDRRLVEGLRAYADHPTKTMERDLPERSVRDLVGSYRNARYREADGLGELVADLHTIPGDDYDWVRALIESAIDDHDAGVTPKAGISVDGDGTCTIRETTDGVIYDVQAFTTLLSADVVTRPGAGGMFLRKLTESLRRIPAAMEPPTAIEPDPIIRRLTESLRGLPAAAGHHPTTSEEEPMKATDMQSRVQAAVRKLRESDGDDTKVTEAITELDELGTATIDVEVRETETSPASDDDQRVAELEAKLRESEEARQAAEADRDKAQGELANTNRALLAAKVVREAEIDQNTYELWFDDLVRTCADEPQMKAYVERKTKERDAIVAQVRESIGAGGVEGHWARTPGTPAAPSGSWADLGIPTKREPAPAAE